MTTLDQLLAITGDNTPPAGLPRKDTFPIWLEGSTPRAIYCLIYTSLGIDYRDKAPASPNKKGRSSLVWYTLPGPGPPILIRKLSLLSLFYRLLTGRSTSVHGDLVTGIKAWRGLKSLDGRGLVPLPVTSTLTLSYKRVMANFALSGQLTPVAWA
ncbi:hypothetical protein BLS_003933 [Venturia inaequalis]|uniref:Uncharacterized protein n=1 Tax=Venturia inaequalis TaxID=5025 RepID=A0A8H3YKJ5_VENIN|nr:hypothetical protein BLS_003933 [Venturia inaequalis]